MTLELVNEWGEISSVVVKDRRPVERMQPILTNDKSPLFGFANSSGYWTSSVTPADKCQHTQTLSELLRVGPVVVGFYCLCWGRYASPFMDMLIQLAGQVQLAGGQMVVFSNEHPRYLPKQALAAPMILVYDVDKRVAQQFGVYSEMDPIWDRISGITEEVCIPALYVVDQAGRIRHHFLDENFDGLFLNDVSPQTDVLAALLS